MWPAGQFLQPANQENNFLVSAEIMSGPWVQDDTPKIQFSTVKTSELAMSI